MKKTPKDGPNIKALINSSGVNNKIFYYQCVSLAMIQF